MLLSYSLTRPGLSPRCGCLCGVHSYHRQSAALRQARDLAVSAVGAGADLLGLVTIRVAAVAVAGLAGVLAAGVDGAGVPVVGVDAAEDAAVDGDDAAQGQVPRPAVAAAVPAAPRHLPVVPRVEVPDAHRPEPVELHDLVRRVERPAPVDVRRPALLLERSARRPR